MKFKIEEFKSGIGQEGIDVEKLMEKRMLERILRITSTRETFIGDGSTSEVFTLKDNRFVCVKVIDEKRLKERNLSMGNSNPLHVEMDYLTRAVKANTSGIRIPKPYLYVHLSTEDKNNIFILMMSRIRGVVLQEIYDGAYGIPRQFDQQRYFDAFRKCLSDLHQERVFHNDIEPTNIMIDLYDCSGGLIDFGETKDFNFPGNIQVPGDSIYDDFKLAEIDREFIDNI